MMRTPWFIRLIVITSIFALVSCAPQRTSYHSFQSKSPGQLRIATYNVNDGEDGLSMSKDGVDTIKAISTLQADVLLLQEVTPQWEQRIRRQVTGYPYRQFRHYENSGGLAILSRYPYRTVKYLTPNHGWHPAWIVEVTTPRGKIQLLNLHLIPPLNKRKSIGVMGSSLYHTLVPRRKEMQYLYSQMEHTPTTIIAGDFNEEDDGVAADFLRSRGYRNALASMGKGHHTWRWRVGMILSLSAKLDRVFYKPGGRLQVDNAQVLHEGESDHYPVVVDFVL